MYYDKDDYDKAFSHLQKAVNIQKDIGAIELETVILFTLAKKNLGKEYDVNENHTLIKDAEYIKFKLNLLLYGLLEDSSYLGAAYNQVQENADNLEHDVKAKFLSYPIPATIVEEWEKVK